jgi:hypothetical protein
MASVNWLPHKMKNSSRRGQCSATYCSPESVGLVYPSTDKLVRAPFRATATSAESVISPCMPRSDVSCGHLSPSIDSAMLSTVLLGIHNSRSERQLTCFDHLLVRLSRLISSSNSRLYGNPSAI